MRPTHLKRRHPNFHPENTEKGAAAVNAIMRTWNAGSPAQPWLYPEGEDYIVADDYLVLAAIERGKPDAIAAQVLGKPYGGDIIEATGPLTVAHVKDMLFGAPQVVR